VLVEEKAASRGRNQTGGGEKRNSFSEVTESVEVVRHRTTALFYLHLGMNTVLSPSLNLKEIFLCVAPS
jgi:hypothetical protein